MGSAPSQRRATVIAGAVVVVLAGGGLLWWKTRDSTATSAPGAAARGATAADPTRPASVHVASELAASSPTGAQPIRVDPANAPQLDAPISKPAPPQQGFTREETIAKREKDLALLDQTRERLEKDVAAAQTAGNTTEAHTLQVRLSRLSALRKQRSSELDQLRAGGAVPP
jgi:hypothetical protein